MQIQARKVRLQQHWYQKLLNMWPFVIFAIATILLLEWQIRYHATLLFSDTLLHFQRIYDIKMQFATHNWSYFQTNYGFYHSGRIFNALYGPAFAYLNGFILYCCRSWFRYQIIVVASCIFIASSSMYLLARKAKVNPTISVLLGLIYPQFGIVIGIFKFNWMAWGAAFAPFVVIQAINMIQDNTRPIHWINLALTMAILAQIHVISTLLMALSLIPFALYAIIKNKNHFKVILDIGKAILVCIGLTANVWGGFLIAYNGNHIASPAKYNLWQHATHLFNETNVHGKVPILLSAIFILQIIYIIFKHKDTLNNLLTGTGLFFLAISSHRMPYKALEMSHPTLGRIIQFPYRMDLVAYIVLLLACGITLTKLSKHHPRNYNLALFSLVLISMQLFGLNSKLSYNRVKRYLNPNEVVLIESAYHIKNRAKIREILTTTTSGKLFNYVSHTEPDYLPYKTGEKLPTAYKSQYGSNIIDKQNYYNYHVHKQYLYLTWHGKKSRNIILPIVMYKQSRLTHNNKPAKILKFTHNYQPVIKQNKGYNQVRLNFVQPKWFSILLWLTVLAWLGVLLFYCYWYLKYHTLFELENINKII